MNVYQISQSFQSMVESIATTNPSEHFVSKDLFQYCMASVANNIIELGKSVIELTWGLKAVVQTLSEKLENLKKLLKEIFSLTIQKCQKGQVGHKPNKRL